MIARLPKLPLAGLELGRISTHWRTYSIRVVPAALASIALMWVWLRSQSMGIEVSEISQLLLATAVLFHIAVAFFITPLLASGAIADEKQERTMPLLVMADFRGWDIFFAKAVGILAQCELLVMATLPLMAFSTLMGGVDIHTIVPLVLLAMVSVAAVATLTIWTSAICNTSRQAMLLTLAIVAIWNGWFWLYALYFRGIPDGAIISPVYFGFYVVAYGRLPGSWLWGVAICSAVIAVMSVWTVYLLSRQRIVEPVGKRRRGRSLTTRFGWTRNPMVVLVEATTHGFTLSFDWWFWRLLVAVGLCIVTVLSVGFGAFAIALVFCYDIAMGMQSIRRSGALDDLLCTPVEHTRVARTFLWVHANRAVPYIPAFLSAYLLFGLESGLDGTWFQWAVIPLLLLPSQILLVICAGSYAGTRTDRAASQSALTILLLVLLPMLAFGITEIHRWFFVGWLPIGRGDREAFLFSMGLILTTLFNLVSAGLCYVGFAGPLREDLITGMARPTPRFRRLSHMS